VALDWLRARKLIGLGCVRGSRGDRRLGGPDWLRPCKLTGLGCVRGAGVSGGSVAPDWLRTCKLVGLGVVRGCGCPAASWPRLASYSQIGRARGRPGFRGVRRLLGPDWLRTCKLVGLGGVWISRGARWLLGPDWLRTRKLVGLGAVRGSGCPAASWPRLASDSQIHWARAGPGFPRCPVASWPRIGFVLANWSGSGAFGFPRRPVASWPRLASSLQIDRLGGGRGARWLGGPGLASYLQVDRARGRPGFRVSGGFLAPIGFVLANCRSGDACGNRPPLAAAASKGERWQAALLLP
jgi:hypothetical protein